MASVTPKSRIQVRHWRPLRTPPFDTATCIAVGPFAIRTTPMQSSPTRRPAPLPGQKTLRRSLPNHAPSDTGAPSPSARDMPPATPCLLYTSDAADEEDSVDLG